MKTIKDKRMTDHMKTVHDIDTDIALARKEITDMNITQYAVPEKVKGKIRYTARCVGGPTYHHAHAQSIFFKLTTN